MSGAFLRSRRYRAGRTTPGGALGPLWLVLGHGARGLHGAGRSSRPPRRRRSRWPRRRRRTGHTHDRRYVDVDPLWSRPILRSSLSARALPSTGCVRVCFILAALVLSCLGCGNATAGRVARAEALAAEAHRGRRRPCRRRDLRRRRLRLRRAHDRRGRALRHRQEPLDAACKPMPVALNHAAIAVHRGDLYVVGGYEDPQPRDRATSSATTRTRTAGRGSRRCRPSAARSPRA